jgi:hypothetical protein
VKQVYSMIPSQKISEYLCKITTGETEWGVDGEREREEWINRVRDGALDRNGNGVGQKWLLVKMDTRVFLVMQINRTNKLSTELGRSRIIQFHWCRNIHFHDDMFCHIS